MSACTCVYVRVHVWEGERTGLGLCPLLVNLSVVSKQHFHHLVPYTPLPLPPPPSLLPHPASPSALSNHFSAPSYDTFITLLEVNLKNWGGIPYSKFSPVLFVRVIFLFRFRRSSLCLFLCCFTLKWQKEKKLGLVKLHMWLFLGFSLT